MTAITPIILAGGAGTRLWPVSRKRFPKQFSNFVSELTLFQDCARRLESSELVQFGSILTVTNSDFRFVVSEQLLEAGIEPGPILLEPSVRNTAAPVLAATLHELQRDPDAVLLVAPSDHLIPDVTAFHKAVKTGMGEVAKGKLVAFGVPPTGPETGYGYLKLKNKTKAKAVGVDAFVEKPDLKTAIQMFNDGFHAWNAGIFLFRAADMLAAFKAHYPGLVAPVQNALKKGVPDLDFFRLEEAAWNECDRISVDHAIMENVSNLSAVPFSAYWSDLGNWNAVREQFLPDQNGVVASEAATAIGCKNVLLRTENTDQRMVGLGLENITAVAMPDAVLIMDSSKTQEVGRVVEALKNEGAPQAEEFPWEHRPWGRFEILAGQDNFKVKRIVVKPGGVLSLQKHRHRSEHWVVVKGTAKITIDGEARSVREGESVYVPLGIAHRMENPGETPMILIEVQTGSYLGEDDIIRLEDRYSRK